MMETTRMTDCAIDIRGLRKTFPGGVAAVSDLDMAVERGSVYAFLGRNGAGKTTTLRILMGLLEPDAGTACIYGDELRRASTRARERVAYVSQTQQLHGGMTLAELCRYVAHFYPRWSDDDAVALAARFELPVNRSIGLLSGGEQRKVAILLALAANPEVLVLDEPAAGLDPIARRGLIDELVDTLARGRGTTVLFSTHIVSDVERLADHVGFLDRGRLVASDSVEYFQTTMKRVQIIFDGDDTPPDFSLPGALRVETNGPVVNAVIRVLSDTQLDFVSREFGARLQEFPLGLEDIYVELLGSAAERGEALS